MKSAAKLLRIAPKRSALIVEHGRVRLLAGLPELHLKIGATGTVIHIYDEGRAFEVEFAARGKPPSVVTLDRTAIEPLAE